MKRLRTALRRAFCRHLNSEVALSLDGPAPGWHWRCWTCGKRKGLED